MSDAIDSPIFGRTRNGYEVVEFYSDSDEQLARGAAALTGRTIVAVECPQDSRDGRNARWQQLVLRLDNGTIVIVRGQGYETDSVIVRVEIPDTVAAPTAPTSP